MTDFWIAFQKNDAYPKKNAVLQLRKRSVFHLPLAQNTSKTTMSTSGCRTIDARRLMELVTSAQRYSIWTIFWKYRNIVTFSPSNFATVFLSKIDNRADLREDRWFCIPNEALNLLNSASAPKTIASRHLRLQNHDLEFQHFMLHCFSVL
jgi:hypothetical protein